MSDDIRHDDREVADLLPFYATRRLIGRDRHRVAVALAADPALQHELALILEEKAATIEVNQALGEPSRAAVDRFFRALDAEAPGPVAVRPGKQPNRPEARWFATLFGGWQPRAVAFGAMAAAVVVVAQAGVIGALLSNRPAAPAATVASLSDARGGASIIVAFDPSASVSAIQAMLVSDGCTIVQGPMPGGLYGLKIGDHPPTKAEVDDMVGRLKSRPSLVRFAAAAG